MATLPRLHAEEKANMIGEELKPLPSKYEDHALNGHPLFWDDIQSVGLFSQLFNDLGV